MSTKKYFQKMKNAKPSKLLVKTLPYVKKYGLVLELGAGPLNDTKYLVKNDFTVFAIDKSPLMLKIAKEMKTDSVIGGALFKQQKIEDYKYVDDFFDLVSAQWCLYFLAKPVLKKTFDKIKNSLKEGGFFCGHLLGEHDSWAKKKSTGVLTKKELLELFESMKIVYFYDEKKMVNGKFWHAYWVIAKKNTKQKLEKLIKSN